MGLELFMSQESYYFKFKGKKYEVLVDSTEQRSIQSIWNENGYDIEKDDNLTMEDYNGIYEYVSAELLKIE